MRERVAVALAAADGCRLRFLSEYRKLADAALAAIRIPTDDMIEAAESVGIGLRSSKEVWQAMYEAALKEITDGE